MFLVFTILLAGALLVFIATPLLSAGVAGGGTVPVDVTPLGDLKRRRMVVYDNLKDLEFEFQAGKIAPPDYQSLRQNYLAEAAQLMLASQEAEKLTAEETLIEREVAARRAARRAAAPVEEYICSKCGHENPTPVKFCGECGARIQPRARK